MTDNEKKLLKVAKTIMLVNSDKPFTLALSGSLLLAKRGIIKPREAHDIDLVLKPNEIFETSNIFSKVSIPEELGLKIIEDDSGYDADCLVLNGNGVIVNILLADEDEVFKGKKFKYAKVKQVLWEKYRFSRQNNSAAKKHQEDLTHIFHYNLKYRNLEYEFEEKVKDLSFNCKVKVYNHEKIQKRSIIGFCFRLYNRLWGNGNSRNNYKVMRNKSFIIWFLLGLVLVLWIVLIGLYLINFKIINL